LSLAIDGFSILNVSVVSFISTAIGVEPDTVCGEIFSHGSETFGHFLDTGDSRGVNVIKTWSETSTE
jgi:hypothetical protein